MNDIDALLDRHIAPLLIPAGFLRHQREFVLTGPAGDRAFLEFHAHLVDPQADVFGVSVTVAPLAYWSWLTWGADPRDGPDASGALALCDILPPLELGWDDEQIEDPSLSARAEDAASMARWIAQLPPGMVAAHTEDDPEPDPPQDWAVTDIASRERCGVELVRLLRDIYLPLMLSIVEESGLATELARPETLLTRLKSQASINLILAAGSVPETDLEGLINAIPQDTPARTELEAWARAR